MIKQYRIQLSAIDDQALNQSMAYQLYGALIKSMNTEFAELLHSQNTSPIAQSLVKDSTKGKALWILNLFGENAIKEVGSVLESCEQFYISPHKLLVKVDHIDSLDKILWSDIICQAHEANQKKYWKMHFNTTTSFKSNNEYMIFPTSVHIINSLINKWNNLSPEYIIEDEYVANALAKGCRITSYHARSNIFTMKGTVIPGFEGYVDITPKLSVPLLEIFKLLMIFSNYSGLGIKTSLGMGNVTVI